MKVSQSRNSKPDSDTKANSTPHISQPSSTPLSELNRQTETHKHILVVDRGSAGEKSVADFAIGLASPAVAVAAIFAVHRLTQSRDRFKAVFELHKEITAKVEELRIIVIAAWSEPKKEDRLAMTRKTIWELQQIGGMSERLRRFSNSYRFSTRWKCIRIPCWKTHEINLISAMQTLRGSITDDPFMNENRRANKKMEDLVNIAIDSFIMTLNQQMLEFMD